MLHLQTRKIPCGYLTSMYATHVLCIAVCPMIISFTITKAPAFQKILFIWGWLHCKLHGMPLSNSPSLSLSIKFFQFSKRRTPQHQHELTPTHSVWGRIIPSLLCHFKLTLPWHPHYASTCQLYCEEETDNRSSHPISNYSPGQQPPYCTPQF